MNTEIKKTKKYYMFSFEVKKETAEMVAAAFSLILLAVSANIMCGFFNWIYGLDATAAVKCLWLLVWVYMLVGVVATVAIEYDFIAEGGFELSCVFSPVIILAWPFFMKEFKESAKRFLWI